MSEELSKLILKRFIARKDVKAIQKPPSNLHPQGSWGPHEEPKQPGQAHGDRIPWRGRDLLAHLSGDQTFGHYMLNTANQCKLFAFDVDLRNRGQVPGMPMPLGTEENFDQLYAEWENSWIETDPRLAWQNRKHPARPFMKNQMMTIANILADVTQKELGVPVAVAYSGNKGIHVYGFTGLVDARDAREGANLVMESVGGVLERGTFQWRIDAFPLFSIEVFPKQDAIDTDGFGNLMRLPLGKHLKSPDPTFFVDMTAGLSVMQPIDPMWALGDGAANPWRREGE